MPNKIQDLKIRAKREKEEKGKAMSPFSLFPFTIDYQTSLGYDLTMSAFFAALTEKIIPKFILNHFCPST